MQKHGIGLQPVLQKWEGANLSDFPLAISKHAFLSMACDRLYEGERMLKLG